MEALTGARVAFWACCFRIDAAAGFLVARHLSRQWRHFAMLEFRAKLEFRAALRRLDVGHQANTWLLVPGVPTADTVASDDLQLLACRAADIGKVNKARFVNNALRALSCALCMGYGLMLLLTQSIIATQTAAAHLCSRPCDIHIETPQRTHQGPLGMVAPCMSACKDSSLCRKALAHLDSGRMCSSVCSHETAGLNASSYCSVQYALHVAEHAQRTALPAMTWVHWPRGDCSYAAAT